ncbi:GT-D fold domain-containing glycosyltransferase [Ammoniphilus sp. 3BR4]|uniref:GT-D fold domain-containing protein n=1 Tax=Ammoniphilus sp. 3BR4 TaxID=3158265 RepID=UPI003466C3F3
MNQLYQRKLLQPDHVFRLLHLSVKKKKPISVIRLGDVMAKLLARKDIYTLKDVSPFLGIPYPPPPKLLRALEHSVRHATVVGVTYFPNRAKQLMQFMQAKQWKPKLITDSFINDQLYENGYLHELIRTHRVALVGRSAEKAAKQLRKKNLHVAITVNLEHSRMLPQTFSFLKQKRNKWDIALVGASVPGRILCVHLTRRLKKTSVEIGHMMDALADPKEWKKHHDRMRFKKRWMKKLLKGNRA